MKVSLTHWACVFAVVLAAVGCAVPKSHNLPPAERLLEPGPGVAGPGPGVLPPAMPDASAMFGMVQPTAQIFFTEANQMEGMQVRWDVGGIGQFDSEPLIVPGRSNFPQGGIYRLKLTNIPNREGVELYPSLEVGPATPRTEAFLAHNAIPIQFTNEDFDQVLTGNFVTKVIYLPDPEFQELALANVETLVSTRLDPGVNPIVEADRRGAIMAVIRLGNKDIEMPGSEADGGILPAGYLGGACATPGYGPVGAAGLMPNYVAGVTSPTWGMPMSGTPIGLAGPPHIPLGSPAGLQSHVMKNHTPTYIPDPAHSFKIHVRQNPGYSYPRPPSRMHVVEQNMYNPLPYGLPHHEVHERVK